MTGRLAQIELRLARQEVVQIILPAARSQVQAPPPKTESQLFAARAVRPWLCPDIPVRARPRRACSGLSDEPGCCSELCDRPCRMNQLEAEAV